MLDLIIDAHAHLWNPQNGMVNCSPFLPLTGGKSDFVGEVSQMIPPVIDDFRNFS